MATQYFYGRVLAATLFSAFSGLAFGQTVAPGPVIDDNCGTWSKRVINPQGDFPAPDTDACTNVFGMQLGYAIANASSVGISAAGSGYAWDASLLCDVRVQQNATDYFLEVWKYKPCEEEEGWAGLTAEVEATGFVDLRTSNTGAVAVGYALASSNMFDQVTAELTESAAETSTSIIGEVSLEIDGFGVAVPVTVSTGTGHYPDHDIDGDTAEDCLNYVKLKRKSRAQMEFYADDGFWVAECNGAMSATATGSISLSTCDAGPSVGVDPAVVDFRE